MLPRGTWHAEFHRLDRAARAQHYLARPTSRHAQRRAAKLLHPAKRVEDRYIRSAAGVMRQAHALVLDAVRPHLASDTRHDATPPDLMKRLYVLIREHLTPSFDTMAKSVNADNRDGHRLLGIDPATIPALQPALARARERNVQRMQAAARRHEQEVNALLADPDVDREDLPDLIDERARVAESRARSIARDETLRTNAEISKVRQQAAGIRRGRWSTSRDERVRPMHRDLEGQVFDYDDPPVTNEQGDTNCPGEDWGCRCVGLPVIAELETPAPAGEGAA
jgi:SPP1 gp7 family putative phage head morphogenesis protein